MGETFPGAKQKGREYGVLFSSRTDVQNASMPGIRVRLHLLHNKIMKLEAGTDRVSSTKIVVCEVLPIVYSDLRISRYFTVFHGISRDSSVLGDRDRTIPQIGSDHYFYTSSK